MVWSRLAWQVRVRDIRGFNQCMAAGTYLSAIQADIDLAKRLALTAAPGIIINGRVLPHVSRTQLIKNIEANLND